MALFQIPDNTEKAQLIENTNYFNWLKENKPANIHSVTTKITYLESLGFKTGIDRITESDLSALKSIEDTYFRKHISFWSINRKFNCR